MSIEILYKAKGYAVVKKPVGADSEDKGESSVPALVRETLGVPYAVPVHRLDLGVGGAMLIATDKKAADRLSRELAENRIEKEYLCICEGIPEARSGKWEDILFYDRKKRKSYVVTRERSGTKRASLSYELLGTATLDCGKSASLVRVVLHTGRTHQVRVQFGSRAHALLGDGKYGSRKKAPSIALMCRAITVDGTRVECQRPDSYPWSLF